MFTIPSIQILPISTSNHMVLMVIWEKSFRVYLTKFWNYSERSEINTVDWGNFDTILTYLARVEEIYAKKSISV